MNAMPEILVGHDAEFFVMDMEGAYQIPLCEGTKDEPLPLTHGHWQRDNIMVELNGIPKANPLAFMKSAQALFKEASSLLLKDKMYPTIAPNIMLSNTLLERDEVKEIGCMPDIDAWTQKQNKPHDFRDLGAGRYGAGHLHFSWKDSQEYDDEYKFAVVRSMDLLLMPALAYAYHLGGTDERDGSRKRRRFYGAPGSMRLKDYGLEYRVPDNTWLNLCARNQAKSVFFEPMFRAAKACIAFPQYADMLYKNNPKIVHEIKRYIMQGNTAELRRMYEESLLKEIVAIENKICQT